MPQIVTVELVLIVWPGTPICDAQSHIYRHKNKMVSMLLVTFQTCLTCFGFANKAMCPDEISLKLLKPIIDSIKGPLPSNRWKITHVKPLFKKGDKRYSIRYRPMWLLSCIGPVSSIENSLVNGPKHGLNHLIQIKPTSYFSLKQTCIQKLNLCLVQRY